MDKRLEFLNQYQPLHDFFAKLDEKYLPLTLLVRKQSNNVDILETEYVNNEYALAVDYVCDFSDGMFCGDIFFGKPEKSRENYVFTAIGQNDIQSLITTFLENNNEFFLGLISKNNDLLEKSVKYSQKKPCNKRRF